MHKEEIREKLEGLREELEETQEEYADVTSEIEDLSNLENEQYRLGDKAIKLEKEIQELERQLIDKEFEELDNTLTGDKFRDAFIKCSWFCRKYGDYNDSLTYVKITGKRLIASDGYRGIIIECDSIPEELKNTFIKWNTRSNFKDNLEIKPIGTLSFIDDAIKKGKGDITFTINEKEFKQKLYYRSGNKTNFFARNDKKYDKEYEILSYNDEKVAFNKEYLDIALKAFKDMDIIVYWPKSNRSPMILESNNQNVILLPIVLSNYDYQ